MNRAAVAYLSVAFLTPLLLAQTKSSTTKRVFRTESGSRAVILPVGKTGESVVDFFSSGGGKSCSADYSSADGSHGFVVAKAGWSPDAQYFVFSMGSSGGHSVMNAPTQFFSLKDKSLCSLDSYVGGFGIGSGDFRLSPPNSVEVRVNGLGTPVRVDLSSKDTRAPNTEHGCVPCKDGAAYVFGDKAQYQHSPN